MKTPRLILFIVVAIGIVAGSYFARSSSIQGDGMEYLVMSKALLRHGSPAATKGDIESLNRHPANKETNVVVFTKDRDADTLPGFFRSNGGAYYSYHFFLYSLFNVPALAIVESLHLPSAYSFALTNSCFAALACMAIFSLHISWLKRATLAVLFVTSGTIFYLPWSHPETFSASLLMIGLCLAYRRRYELAAISTAIASTQNPPIALITAAYLCWDFYIQCRDSGKICPPVSKIAWWSGAVFVTGLPSLFYYLNFSTPNLIAAHGGSIPELISFARLVSVYLDLNQGAIMAAPTLLALPIFVAYRALDRRSRGELAMGCILILLSLLICIPALSAPNWSSAFTVVMRYACWIGVPLLFSLVLLTPDTRVHHRLGLVLISIVQLATCYLHGGVNAVKTPAGAGFSPVAKLAITKLPSLYNPIPQIFIELGGGAAVTPSALYFQTSHGLVTKLLYHRDYVTIEWPPFIDKEKLLANNSVMQPSEMGWVYINPDHSVSTSLPDGFYRHTQPFTLDPNHNYGPSESRLFYHGWSVDEGTHRWSIGNESVLRFKLPAQLQSQARLVIDGTFYRPQKVTIKIAGEVVQGASVDQTRLTIPIAAIPNPRDEVLLSLQWSAPLQPPTKYDRAIAYAINKLVLIETTQP